MSIACRRQDVTDIEAKFTNNEDLNNDELALLALNTQNPKIQSDIYQKHPDKRLTLTRNHNLNKEIVDLLLETRDKIIQERYILSLFRNGPLIEELGIQGIITAARNNIHGYPTELTIIK